MKFLTRWKLPVPTVSEANCSEHWVKKHKRHKTQHKWVLYASNREPIELLPESNVLVAMIRVSPRNLDADDNLPSAFKYIRDQLAACLIPGKPLGFADSDSRLKWKYSQMTPKEAKQTFDFQFAKGIIIEFYDLTCEHSHNEI